jgi:hypothetical protein
MPEKGSGRHIGRWAHRLLGADSDLPATVIKPPEGALYHLKVCR